MVESTKSISAWAEATFGPVSSSASIAARALREGAELAAAEGTEAIAAECADVAIVCARLADRLGFDFFATVWQEVRNPASEALDDVEDALLQLVGIWHVLRRCGGRDDVYFGMKYLLYHLAHACQLLGCDLGAEVDRKMAINRGREWTLDGTGHGQHVRLGVDFDLPSGVLRVDRKGRVLS